MLGESIKPVYVCPHLPVANENVAQLFRELKSIWESHHFVMPRDWLNFIQEHSELSLHHEFVWDDAKAANEFRASQLSRLISFVPQCECWGLWDYKPGENRP